MKTVAMFAVGLLVLGAIVIGISLAPRRAKMRIRQPVAGVILGLLAILYVTVFGMACYRAGQAIFIWMGW